MSVVEGLLFSWNKNKDYGARLVADLSDDQMVLQPAPAGQPGANHPAWVLSHLNAYLPVIQAIIQGETFEDPKDHPFGMTSKPEADASVYASKDALIAEFVSGHEKIAALLEASGDEAFSKPITLPRWEKVMPSAGIALPYLMLNHENTHLGQLSTWRRVQGMPSV